ncbi:GntR family transcriptional regulator [Caproiciproducens sp. R1]|uniref:GntR family transcriptional regulator n=1 Tax=Caproiciproducens sp. R1 TaxID=3435000 RepID=UPI004033319B
MPIFKDIENFIEQNIINGNYPKGSLLPSEQDFCKMFNTSRMTVRRAFDELAANDLIYRIKGKGSVVSRFDVGREYSLKGFSQMMAAKGVDHSSKILRTATVKADEKIAKRLHVNEGDSVYNLERVQYLYEEPVAIENLYYNARLLPHLLDHDFTKGSIYQTLEEQYNKKIIRIEQKISTLDIKGEYAKILFGRNSATVLYLRGVGYDMNAVPIEYGRTCINGNKYSLDVLIQ